MAASAKCAARACDAISFRTARPQESRRVGHKKARPKPGCFEVRPETVLIRRLSVHAVQQARTQGFNRPFEPGQPLPYRGHVTMQIPQEQQNTGNSGQGHIVENLLGHPVFYRRSSVNIQQYISPAFYRLSRTAAKSNLHVLNLPLFEPFSRFGGFAHAPRFPSPRPGAIDRYRPATVRNLYGRTTGPIRIATADRC